MNIDVMHGSDRVVLQINARIRTVVVLTPDEAEELAQRIRDQARHARDLALIPREDADV